MFLTLLIIISLALLIWANPLPITPFRWYVIGLILSTPLPFLIMVNYTLEGGVDSFYNTIFSFLFLIGLLIYSFYAYDAWSSLAHGSGMAIGFILSPMFLITVLNIWVLPGAYNNLPDQPFDIHTWQFASPNTSGLIESVLKCSEKRGEMVKDLMRNHNFVGMAKGEVQQLLGPADAYRADGGFGYCLRPRFNKFNAYPWNPMSLVFDVGATETVTQVKIRVYPDSP